MAVSSITSQLQITDANGDPVSGAKINVYDAGTTTPKSLFSNAGLSVSAANPIVCDSAGRHDMRYFATDTYKIVVTTSAGVPIYTRDFIDPGVPLGTGVLAVVNGGTGASTAGGARTNLGVPSQTEMDAAVADIADLQAQLSAISSIPQGYLTINNVTTAIIITTDFAAQTNVYYQPYIGNQIPVYNGTLFQLKTFGILTLVLVANHLASTIYDCFVINDSGTIRLVTGPAWNNSAAGSGSRGSGAGTTELVRLNGLWVNNNSMTARFGASTVTVDAFKGTYVGSIFMDAAAGQVTCHRSYGQSRKWSIWNAYNRVPIILKAGDSTASWTYNTNTIRQSNAAAGNTLAVFCGLPEEMIDLSFLQKVGETTGSATQPFIAIGVNSTTVISGTKANSHQSGGGGSAQSQRAEYNPVPFLGINNINSLENGATSGGTFYGTEPDMLLKAIWRG